MWQLQGVAYRCHKHRVSGASRGRRAAVTTTASVATASASSSSSSRKRGLSASLATDSRPPHTAHSVSGYDSNSSRCSSCNPPEAGASLATSTSSSTHSSAATKTKKTVSFKLLTVHLKGCGAWRRVTIPDYCSFGDLHEIIQCVFDYTDFHLHWFQEYAPKRVKMEAEEMRALAEADIGEYFRRCNPQPSLIRGGVLRRYLQKKDDKLYYEYDMGDTNRFDVHVSAVEDVSRELGTELPKHEYITVVRGASKRLGDDCCGKGHKYDRKRLNRKLKELSFQTCERCLSHQFDF